VCQPPAVCPAEDFCCDQPSSFFATGQFLFWTAHEDGLNYAVTGVSVAGLSGDVAAGSTKQVSNKWRPAFRVGVGYGLPDKTWDVLVNWTRFEQNSHSTTSSSSTPTLTTNNALLGTWLSPKFTWNALNSANAHWHLLYNTVDVPFRRNIQICRDFVFSPHAGLKGAWINQRYNMNYAALTLPPTGVTEGTLPPLNASARNKNDFHSVGLRAGFDSEFHFNHHLSFYGNAAGSLVYGTFHVKERFTLNIVSPAPGAASTIDVINTKDKTHSVKPEIETAVGLRWQQDFCNTDLQLLVDIGYEFQLWVNQNQMLRFLNGNRTESPLHNGGDLSFQGLVVGAELRF
jgi:hypothetical protein